MALNTILTSTWALTSQLSPSDEMFSRWLKNLELNIPSFNFIDADSTFKYHRQESNDTEYSQLCYQELLYPE